MRYALIKDSIVQSFVDTTAETVATIAESTGTVAQPASASIFAGMKFVDGKFLPPDPTPVNLGTRISVLSFLKRFTDAEAVAIDLGSIGATVQAASLRRYVAMVNAAKFIDLSREDTRAGVIALETNGILSAGRALQILDTPVKQEELA